MFNVSEKWGFGMAPAKPQTQRDRKSACRAILEILSLQSSPEPIPELLDQISLVKGLFNRIVREDQWDWFTVMGQLGYQSPGLAHQIARELYNMRQAVRDSNEEKFRTAQLDLCRMPTRLCLSAFLGEAKIIDEIGAGWIYILSSREFPELLKIGMTTRTVEQRANEINAATGVAIPFGVRRCWRVTNPAIAEKAVHRALEAYRLRNDREFFKTDFKIAAKIAHAVISSTGLEIRTLKSLASLGKLHTADA